MVSSFPARQIVFPQAEICVEMKKEKKKKKKSYLTISPQFDEPDTVTGLITIAGDHLKLIPV